MVTGFPKVRLREEEQVQRESRELKTRQDKWLIKEAEQTQLSSRDVEQTDAHSDLKHD